MLSTVLRITPLWLLPSVALAAAPDNDVMWDGLFADTTPQFVSPRGFKVGDTVTLRLRAWADDLTAAECRVYLAGPDQNRIVPMTREEADGAFDFWRCEFEVPPGTQAIYHHFAVTDGTDTDFYDAGAPGDAWNVRGVTDQERAFHDFRSYLGFQAPDWSRGAIFYQIFPDRFSNGNPNNDRVLPDDCLWYLDFAPASLGRPECTAFVVPEVPQDHPKHCLIHERWDEDPTGSPCDFFGGDLEGIDQNLEYIRDLGATAIYLNPVFRSPSNHKYDTMTFEAVDPRLGGTTALDSLVKNAHAAGLAVIADGVFNHVADIGDFFGGWQNYQLGQQAEGIDAFPEVCGAWEDLFLSRISSEQTCQSPYRDWFRMEFGNDRWDVDRDGNRDELAVHPCGWAGLGFMPEIDYGDPTRNDSAPRNWLYGGQNAAQTEVAAQSIAGKWLADGVELSEGLDGWRLDVPDNAGYFTGQGTCGKVAQDPTIWQGFRRAVKAIGQDKYISGEIWTDATQGGVAGDWFRAQTYDAVMNYHFFSAPLGCLLNGLGVHGDPNECQGPYQPMTQGRGGALAALDTHLAEQRRLYPADAYLSSMNLLSSHDSWRFASRGPRELALATILQMTLPGAAMIYYGDELGVEGPSNELGRATMPWTLLQEPEHPRVVLRENVRRWACLRKTQPALATGSFMTLGLTDADYIFGRFEGDQKVLVAANLGDQPRTVTVDPSRLGTAARWVELAGGFEVGMDGENLQVTLPGKMAAVLVPEAQAAASSACLTPNQPPIADAGADRAVGLGEVVHLDASGARDPEGRPLRISWRNVDGRFLGQGVTVAVADLPEGTHVFWADVSDGVYTSSDSVQITMAQGAGPDPQPDAGSPDAQGSAPSADAGVFGDAAVTATENESEGCGCNDLGSTQGGWFALLPLLLLIRKRY